MFSPDWTALSFIDNAEPQYEAKSANRGISSVESLEDGRSDASYYRSAPPLPRFGYLYAADRKASFRRGFLRSHGRLS